MEIASALSALLLTVLCANVCLCASALKEPITLDDTLIHRYAPDSFNGTWVSRNEYIYLGESSVFKYNVDSQETTALLSKADYESFNLTDVTVSADGQWISLQHDEESIFRHSTTSLYTLIHLHTGERHQLANGQRVQLLIWAPAGAHLVFILNNDVFYQSESDRRNNTFRRITDSPSYVYNGVADWVYEEEVLGESKALWFSPGGNKIVFATMNDTNVRNVTFWKYGDPGKLSSQYAKEVVIKYPKVGTRNPVAFMNYVDLESGSTTPVKIKAPEDLVSSDNILGPVSWADESHFSISWMTRLQNLAFTQLCPTSDPAACKTVYSYKEDEGWLEIEEPVWVNSTMFLTVLPFDQGGQLGNYRQLALVKAATGEAKPLSSGNSTTTGINCYDPQTRTVYYSRTVDGDSAKRLVYKINLDTFKTECVSCVIDPNCAYGTAYFSTECANAVLSCKGPDVPQFHIYDKEGRLKRQLSNNTELREQLANLSLATRLDLSVPVSEGFSARVRLLLPPNVDTSGRTKYPLLFNVYSGPDSNKISDAWPEPGWEDYLSGRRGVVVAFLDSRGSGLGGDKLKFAVYHRLGGPEVDDIITVGRHLQQTLPYIDPLRTGIWGWSYGGFATAMTLAKDDANVFRCGISVAPVTNWIYYDTVYTERFMGLPTNESNLAGYLASDVSSQVENFRHKLFYLIHGNADDNVHYQQSMALSRALQLADILFLQQSYPDENHSLQHVRRHLFHSMDAFWSRCFHLKHTDHGRSEREADLSAETDYSSD